MNAWFERRQPEGSPSLPAPVHYVSATTTIRAPRQDVWEFIKPPENSVLLNPEVIRGFRAPSLEGAPEIQVFISIRDGVETVSAIEVLEEVPGELNSSMWSG